MKAKIKGQSGVKGLLLLHGEKILMAMVGIGALALVYFAVKTERLPDKFEADKLKSQVGATKSGIEDPNQNNWSKVSREHPEAVRTGEKLVERDALTVNDDDYRPRNGWNPPILTQHRLRTDPALAAAADVRAYGGAGLFAFNDEETMRQQDLRKKQEEVARERNASKQQEDQLGSGRRGARGRRGDDRIRTEIDPEHPNRRPVESMSSHGGVTLQGGELVEFAHWVTVVAKVPLREQRSLYRNAFEDAGGFDPDLDSPSYVGYFVQRAEVIAGQEPQWQDVAVYDAKGTPVRKQLGNAMGAAAINRLLELAANEWVQGPGEIVDVRYLDPVGVLAFPLPPLIGRDWGSEATHPEIPLASASRDDAMDEPAGDALPTTPVQGAAGDEFANPNQGANAIYGGRSASRPEAGSDRGSSRPMPGGGRGGFTRGAAVSGRRAGNLRGTPSAQTGLSVWLLRFFDFTVVPGKKYTYRVQLVLDDPNLATHVKRAYLEPKVAERIKKLPKGSDNLPLPAAAYRRTDWSEPTTPVGVPLDGSVRMAGVQPADEPRTKLMVEAFGKDPKAGNWIQATPPNAEKEREFTRGSVVNFVDDAEFLVENGAYIDKTDSFRFYTGVTVVDMRGGERLGSRGDFTAPSRVLLMDPTGELSIRRELDDEAEVKAHRDTFAKKKTTDGQGDPSRRRTGGR